MQDLPTAVKNALSRLQEAGYEAYIVGGCVRSALLGQKSADYDITTSAHPEQTMAVFAGERVIETGLRHGTVTVLLDGEALEITTFRVDGTYSDARHPDAVRFTNALTEDLARRDFTMNAIACDLSGDLHDPFGGQKDIAAHIIRCVGEPQRRFEEDALRILRALRFAATLGFALDADTDAALRRSAPRLKNISAERIRTELLKLLCGKNARRIVLDYVDVLGVILPELLPMKGFDQHHPCHIYDVLEHSVVAMENTPPEGVLRLTALLHDVGKPDCFTLDEAGNGHFYGHPQRGVEIAENILARLKLERAASKRILLLIKYHDQQIEGTEKSVRRLLSKIGPDAFRDLMLIKRADNFGQGMALRHRQGQYDVLEQIADKILSEHQCFSLRDLAVSGRDLMALGMREGPEIGKALRFLLAAVMDERVENEKDALLAYLKESGRAS